MGAAVQERLGLGDRGIARVVLSDRPQVPHGGRVDDPHRPVVLRRHRRPVRVEAPAHVQVGERQQHPERVGVQRGHRTDLDEAGAPRQDARAPPRDLPGGMRGVGVRRLGEPEAEALGAGQEGVEEPARQRHVVVDEQQPVVAVRRVGGQRRVEVRPLARAGGGRRRPQLDVVARARELPPQCLALALVPGARHAEHEHAPPRLIARPPREGDPRRQSACARDRVVDRAEQRGAARERAGVAGQVLGPAGRERRRRERLAQPPGGQRGEHDAVAAAVADRVPNAAGERAQLAGDRRRDAAARVPAAREAPALVAGPRERADPRVGAGAPVIDSRRRDVAQPAAGRAQAVLPLLLVAVAAERGVERADPLDRRPPQREVRAPQELGVAVVRAEVEVGDGQRLAAAGAQVAALEARPDRPAEGLVPGVGLGRLEQGAEPAVPDVDVVVEEAEQVARGGVDRGVARDVDAALLAERDVARAVPLGDGLGRGVARVVLDDDQLGPVALGLAGGRGQRDGQISGRPRVGKRIDAGVVTRGVSLGCAL